MEFDSLDLDDMVIHLLDEQSTDVDSDSGSSTMTEHSQPSSLHEQEQQSTTTQDSSHRQYCFIIFNNAKWSHRLGKQSEHTEQQQQHQRTHSTISQASGVKEERQDLSLDDGFTIQLRQLFDHYMQHTKRPFPIKYFIDFTDQLTQN